MNFCTVCKHKGEYPDKLKLFPHLADSHLENSDVHGRGNLADALVQKCRSLGRIKKWIKIEQQVNEIELLNDSEEILNVKPMSAEPDQSTQSAIHICCFFVPCMDPQLNFKP